MKITKIVHAFSERNRRDSNSALSLILSSSSSFFLIVFVNGSVCILRTAPARTITKNANKKKPEDMVPAIAELTFDYINAVSQLLNKRSRSNHAANARKRE